MLKKTTIGVQRPDYLPNVVRLSERPTRKYWKVLGYGDTKAGKTYFGGTFPGADKGEMLIIDTDGSLDGLPPGCKNPLVFAVNREQINSSDRSKRIPLYESIINILSELQKDGAYMDTRIQTLMFDGLSSLSMFIKDECMWTPMIGDKPRNPVNTKATWDEYETLKSRLETIFSMVNELEMNIYVTAFARRDKDDVTGSIIGMPDCEGSFRKKVGGYFSAVLFFEETDGTHKAYTATYNRLPASIRRGYRGPKVVNNPTFGTVFASKNFGG